MGCALVTGAGRRLGLAMARARAADGWPVALAARNSFADACAEARDITVRGGKARAIRGDLADRQTPARVVREAMEELGPVTLLVNSAAVFIDDGVRTAGPDTIDANINTNLIAPMLLTRAFFEQLPPSTQGCVINMLDQRVTNPTPRYMSYTASKVALEAMTRTSEGVS